MKQTDFDLQDEFYEIKMDKIENPETDKLDLGKKLEYIRQLDKRTQLALGGILLSFLSSFFNFWGVKIESLGNLGYGNLFNGFKLGGILGILFVLFLVAAFVLTYFRKRRYAMLAAASSCIVFLLQVIIIAFWGKGSFSGFAGIKIYFGVGFYLCLTGILLYSGAIFSIYYKGKKEKENKKAQR